MYIVMKNLIHKFQKTCLVNPVNLEKSQWWNYDQFEEFQNKRLRKIIKYAYCNIPGYREKFDREKLKPEDIKTKNDLWKIPITTREELQDNPNFINKKLIVATLYTGGSTGTSLRYYDSKESYTIRWNSHYRGWSWNGYASGEKLAVISSAQAQTGVNNKDNILNIIGDLTFENLEKNVKLLKDFQPRFLRGYVSSLYILAKYCLDNDIRLDRIESVVPISENLYPFQRKAMEKAFNCKVFEEYCCNDGGACAWECSAHEGLHYFMERSIIEEINGEIIVTDLWNKAMPFIRYKNGDSVKFLDKKCSCGRELPLIEVKGRDNDIIISPKNVISPSFLIHHGIGLVGVDKEKHSFRSCFSSIQYVQKPGFILEINIVKNHWCSENDVENFKKDLQEFTKGMELKINFVDEIPKTQKGKRNFIINEDKELLEKYKNSEFVGIK